MTDIARDQPGDAKQRRIEAQARMGRCDECQDIIDRSNLRALKDGRRVCPLCFNAILLDLFVEAEANEEYVSDGEDS
jgi:phosphatidylserine/phosphatidylglycerophosphate/cardiolipin synthase-like enzyme